MPQLQLGQYLATITPEAGRVFLLLLKPKIFIKVTTFIFFADYKMILFLKIFETKRTLEWRWDFFPTKGALEKVPTQSFKLLLKQRTRRNKLKYQLHNSGKLKIIHAECGVMRL